MGGLFCLIVFNIIYVLKIYLYSCNYWMCQNPKVLEPPSLNVYVIFVLGALYGIFHFVVPKNIRTPPTEGIGNSWGWVVPKDQKI